MIVFNVPKPSLRKLPVSRQQKPLGVSKLLPPRPGDDALILRANPKKIPKESARYKNKAAPGRERPRHAMETPIAQCRRAASKQHS
jgi:hypothetical protein